jgi:hypothetical protein
VSLLVSKCRQDVSAFSSLSLSSLSEAVGIPSDQLSTGAILLVKIRLGVLFAIIERTEWEKPKTLYMQSPLT